MPAPDFESLLERLIRHQVDFVVIGGFAAVAHGVSLLTDDLDICCPFDEASIQRLHQSIADLHPVHRMTPQRMAFDLAPGLAGRLQNLYLKTDFGILDCLSSIKGVGDFADVKRHSVIVQLPIGPCRILDMDALIRAKEAIGEPKDLLTVRQLRAIQERKRNTSLE